MRAWSGNPWWVPELEVGDYVTHIDHGIGTFGGLQESTFLACSLFIAWYSVRRTTWRSIFLQLGLFPKQLIGNHFAF